MLSDDMPLELSILEAYAIQGSQEVPKSKRWLCPHTIRVHSQEAIDALCTGVDGVVRLNEWPDWQRRGFKLIRIQVVVLEAENGK